MEDCGTLQERWARASRSVRKLPKRHRVHSAALGAGSGDERCGEPSGLETAQSCGAARRVLADRRHEQRVPREQVCGPDAKSPTGQSFAIIEMDPSF